MPNVNPKNERLKLDWTTELAKEFSPATVDQRLAALAEYETATDCADFAAICEDKVAEYISAVLARDIASRTRVSNVRQVKRFFEYLVMTEQLSGKRAYGPIKSLKLPRKNRQAGRASKTRPVPTLAQITDTIYAMPKTTATERRNRALIAFTLLSGARDGAIVSMTAGHVNLAGREVMQHPDEVDTKGSAHIHTWFFPVGQMVIDEVADYLAFLRNDLGFTESDPLFPATRNGHDENRQFTPYGLSKARWANAQPMRDVFRAAFVSNDLPYFNPHSFRKTLMARAYELGLSGEALKAWSQNLGHKKLDTSINSYGAVSRDRQKAAILKLHDVKFEPDSDDQVLTLGAFKALLAERDGQNLPL